MIFRLAALFSTLCLLQVLRKERMYSTAYLTVSREPTLQRRTCTMMNSNQVPISPTNSRSILVKNSMFGIGSMLSAALLKREKAVAIDLPECSDSVTIFRRATDKREVNSTCTCEFLIQAKLFHSLTLLTADDNLTRYLKYHQPFSDNNDRDCPYLWRICQSRSKNNQDCQTWCGYDWAWSQKNRKSFRIKSDSGRSR